MQTISTKFLPATNSRRERVKATTSSGISLIVGWDYALEPKENHLLAVIALKNKLGWRGEMVAGDTNNGVVAVKSDDTKIEQE